MSILEAQRGVSRGGCLSEIGQEFRGGSVAKQFAVHLPRGEPCPVLSISRFPCWLWVHHSRELVPVIESGGEPPFPCVLLLVRIFDERTEPADRVSVEDDEIHSGGSVTASEARRSEAHVARFTLPIMVAAVRASHSRLRLLVSAELTFHIFGSRIGVIGPDVGGRGNAAAMRPHMSRCAYDAGVLSAHVSTSRRTTRCPKTCLVRDRRNDNGRRQQEWRQAGDLPKLLYLWRWPK